MLKNELKLKEIDAIPVYEVMLEMFARGVKFKNVSLTKSLATEFKIESYIAEKVGFSLFNSVEILFQNIELCCRKLWFFA